MNRRKIVRSILLLACPLILRSKAISQVSECEWKNDLGLSPHGEAIALVIKNQKAEIEKVEAEHFGITGGDNLGGISKERWWHDTIERGWSASRPFAPGVINSTHYFIVSYRIGIAEVGRWSVDTRKGTTRFLPKGAVM
jgi:hypothetical protein